MIGWVLGGVFAVCCLIWCGAWVIQLAAGLALLLGHVLMFLIRAIVFVGAGLYWLFCLCIRPSETMATYRANQQARVLKSWERP